LHKYSLPPQPRVSLGQRRQDYWILGYLGLQIRAYFFFAFFFVVVFDFFFVALFAGED